MARILDIYNKDVYGVVEISSENTDDLIRFLDAVEMHYDSAKNPELKKAADYVVNTFYPLLKDLKQHMGGA